MANRAVWKHIISALHFLDGDQEGFFVYPGNSIFVENTITLCVGLLTGRQTLFRQALFRQMLFRLKFTPTKLH